MTDTASITEAFAFLILIVPGFITFRILSWRASFEFVFSDLLIILYSLIFSVIDFIPLALHYNFQSITDLETRILNPKIILVYFAIAIVIGFVLGEILHRRRRNVVSGSVWTNFAFENIGDWIQVYTNKDVVFRGWLKLMATHESHKRELELGEAEVLEIVNNKKTWRSVGKSILFTENDIARITLWSDS